MVTIGLLWKIGGFLPHERRLETELSEYRNTFTKSGQIPFRVIGRQIFRELIGNNKLEKRRAMHRPIRIRIMSVAIPLPQRRLNRTSRQVSRFQILGKSRIRTILIAVQRIAFNADSPIGPSVRQCTDRGTESKIAQDSLQFTFHVCIISYGFHLNHPHFGGGLPSIAKQANIKYNMDMSVLPSLLAVILLRSVAEVSQALLAIPAHEAMFDIHARVTCIIHHAEGYYLTVEDSTGSVFLTDHGTNTALTAGNEIRATGCIHYKTASCAQAAVDTIHLIAQGQPPVPRRISGPDFVSGRSDWKYATVTGVVRNVILSETDSRWAFLIVGSDSVAIPVSVPLFTRDKISARIDDLKTLIGHTISVNGFGNPRDRSLRLHLGRSFHSRGLSDIKDLSQSADDPFDVPSTEALRHFSIAQIAALGSHRAVGHVLAVTKKGEAVIETAQGDVITLSGLGESLPSPGSTIEAAGFPQANLFHLTLTHVQWRTKSALPFNPRPCQPISPSFILDSRCGRTTEKAELHGRDVEIRGIIKNLPSAKTDPYNLIIECESHIISIDTSMVGRDIPDVSVGCTISVRGTFLSEMGDDVNFPQIKGFRIVLNSADNLRVIATPPFWNIARLSGLVGLLIISLAGVFVWNRSLKALAIRKSRALLREQLAHVKSDLRIEERTRLAVELHDTLSQNLTGVSMEIEAANDLRGGAPQSMLDHLDIAAKALKSCRIELRNCLWDLRSQALEEKDMTKAILRTLQPQANSAKLSVRFNVPRSKLSDNTTHSLLRAIRELVSNAIRHGAATSIKIAGALDENQLLCSVTDNGCGFDPDDSPGVLQGHFGLQGIQERIEGIDGTFTITSEIGKGTRALISLPIPKEVNPTQSPAVRKNTDSHNN